MLTQTTLNKANSLYKYVAKERILILMEAAELGNRNGALTTKNITDLMIKLSDLDNGWIEQILLIIKRNNEQ